MVSKIKISTTTQFIAALLTFFFTFLLPLLSYIQLFQVFDQTEEIRHLRPQIFFISILTIVIGGFLTGLRYIVFYFDKHTLKRNLINFTSTLLVLLLLVNSAQLGVVQVRVGGSQVFLDVRGVFILLIVSWALIVAKTIYDIIEVKLYPESAPMITAREKLRSKGLVKCRNCKYMCRKEWKKCPICKSALAR